MAQVSPSAVSRYLNGGPLSEEKRRRIQAAVEQTGYHPDSVARTLRTKTTNLVGLIVPKTDSDAVTQVTAGAASALAEHRYLSLLADTANDPAQELAYLNLFQKQQVAGIIFMASVMTAELENALRSTTVPVVVTGQKFRQVPCVYHDDQGAAYDLACLMLKRGRRRLAFIGVTEADVAVGVNRRRGVEAAMREYGLEPASLLVETGSFRVENGLTAMKRLLQRDGEIDGVICATDRIAVGALDVLRRSGRRVPEDVSVIGMDDSWAGSYITPPLTTARFYYRTCGEQAARLLVELIRNRKQPAPVQQTMLGYTVLERESV